MGWIWRMMLGMGLVGLSLWSIALCEGIFRTYVGPEQSPADTSFAKLAAGAAWFVFFGPIAAVGLTMLWSAQRRLGVLDRLAAWREARAERAYGYPGGKPHVWHVVRSEESSHEDLESLNDEKVAQLIKRARRAVILLGLSAGTFFVVIGVCGLIFVSSSLHLSSTVSFAILSGISILVGLKVLQCTIRKENNAWLLPLKLFTDVVLRQHGLSPKDAKSRLSERVR